jgi:prolyl-tRNA synthetase
MKDLYSFSKDQKDLDEFYERSIVAYRNIFSRLGIGDRTYLTLASGGTFGTKYSHEFQTLTPAGEDIIYIHKEKNIAINKEVMNAETMEMLGVKESELVAEKSIEVGNIYKLGDFYSKPLGLTYKTETGEVKPVIMGSYGIGISRLMGTVVEALADDKGLVWPENISPFKVHLILLGSDESLKKSADEIYESLLSKNIEVLYDDDSSGSAGERFANSDLIGIPLRIVVGKKFLSDGKFEVVNRASGKIEFLSRDELIKNV